MYTEKKPGITRQVIWVFLGCLCLSYSVQAQESELFTARVAVERQDSAARKAGQRKALEQVFVKVSGVSGIVSHSAVATAVDRVEEYVTRFGFLSEPLPGRSEIQLYMNASFDSAKILRLLRSENLPVWTGSRPRILAWVALSDSQGKRILDAASEEFATAILLDQAEIRGIPILLPIMDLVDSEYVDATAVLDNLDASLRLATRRYRTEGMLALGVTEDTASWSANWSFYWDQEIFVEQMSARDPEDILRRSVDLAVDRLALRYATLAPGQGDEHGEARTQWIQVNRVRDLRIYSEILDFFSEISGIDSIQLVRVNGESLLFGIRSRHTRDHMLQLLKLNYRLQQSPDSDPAVIRLFWNG